jgi:outer membrane protein assembly factor BamB
MRGKHWGNGAVALLLGLAACGESPPPPAPEPEPGCDAQEWQVLQLGTAGQDMASALAVDGNCRIFFAATTDGTWGTETPAGSTDALLGQLRADGRLAWAHTLGSPKWDEATDLALTPDGALLLMGSTEGAMPGKAQLGETDLFLTRYGTDGTRQWLEQRGSSGPEMAGRLALAPEGVWMVGSTLATPERGWEVTLERFAIADGRPQRLQTFGAKGVMFDGDVGHAAARAPDGGLYAVGTTLGPLASEPQGSFDLFLIRNAPEGERLWTRQLGTSDTDAVFDVAVDARGDVVVLAMSYSDLATGASENDGRQSPFLLKFSPEGELRWIQRLGAAEDFSRAQSLALDAEGHIYVAGTTTGALDGANQGGRDAFVARYTPDGLRTWARQLGTPADEEVQDVTLSPRGDVLVLGTTQGELPGGGGLLGGQDLFLARWRADGSR